MPGNPQLTAVGFRVKSGWAVAVLLRGPARAPVLLDCRPVALSDPRRPEQRQPFHSALEIHGARGAREAARLAQEVRRHASRSLARLLRAYRRNGARPLGVGVVVGSLVDPRTIANPHIRAHAEEGRLFREVTVAAAHKARLRSLVVLERELPEAAAGVLGRPTPELRALLAEMRRGLAGPWRADQKNAALAAWVLLAAAGPTRRTRSPSRNRRALTRKEARSWNAGGVS
ncbi:MAG TPA: hypothetical protein VNI61_12400 [Gemmatimonadales bacterium]|nr:hypothetical protein [Gemmatimonadales bacterium]